MNWYLLQTKSNGHAKACGHLERQGFEVFLPLIIRTTQKNNKFLDTTAPLFPGYLFIGTSTDPVPWKSINGTKGISSAVTLDGVYRPIHKVLLRDYKADAMNTASFK